MTDDRYKDLDDVWADRGFKAYAKFTDHPVREGAKWVGGFIVFLFVLSLIGNATGIANIYWQAEQAKLTVKPRVTIATYGTDNALRNIAYFHDMCNSIVALNLQIKESEQTLLTDQATLSNTNWAGNPIGQQQAASAVTQDGSTLAGQKQQLANDAGDYDSKSATQTSNPFKAANLPYRITIGANGLVSGDVNCE